MQQCDKQCTLHGGWRCSSARFLASSVLLCTFLLISQLLSMALRFGQLIIASDSLVSCEALTQLLQRME